MNTPRHPPKFGGLVSKILQYGRHIFLEQFSKNCLSNNHAGIQFSSHSALVQYKRAGHMISPQDIPSDTPNALREWLLSPTPTDFRTPGFRPKYAPVPPLVHA